MGRRIAVAVLFLLLALVALLPARPAAAWMAGVSPVVQSRLPAVGLSKNR